MELVIKYKRLAGLLMLLLTSIIFILDPILFNKLGASIPLYIYSVLIGFIAILSLFLSFMWLFEKNALIISNGKIKLGYGLCKISFNLNNIAELKLEQKYFPELIIILKDTPEANIKLNIGQKILNVVSRIKISRNALKINNTYIKYDLKKLKEEIEKEIKTLRN